MDIATALAALRSTYELMKAAIGIRDDAKIADAVKGFNTAIIQTNNSVIALQEKVRSLEQLSAAVESKCRQLENENTELRRKTREREKYRVVEISEQILALQLKSEIQTDEPAHYLCQPCMDNANKKATLQRVEENFEILLVCPECKFKYPTGKYRAPVIA